MPKYLYKARDALGKQVEGMLEAADEKAVAQRLAQTGYYVTTIKPKRDTPRATLMSRLRGVRRRQMIMFSRQLGTMVKAGMPLLSGINILIQQTTDPAFNAILREIWLDLNEGTSFTRALSKHPRVFSKLYVSTIRVGEETGNFELVLARLADHIEWEDSLRAAIIGSLTYPIVVLCVALAVAVFLLTKVLPEFQRVYSRARVPLPSITKFMFGLSNIFTGYWYVILATVVGAYLIYTLFKHTSGGRLTIDSFKLRLPIIKGFVSRIAAVRFARSMEIMARSGVHVVSALEIIKETMTNEVYARAVADMAAQVQSGRTIGSALADHPEFEPMLVQMIVVGEETGQIDEMLAFVGDAYEQQIEYMSKNLPKVIEPLLLILLAFLVAVIALSLFLPIFRMVQVMKSY